MASTAEAEPQTTGDEGRLASLFGVIDLIGRDTRLDEFLPHLAGELRAGLEFDLFGVVLPDRGAQTVQLHAVGPVVPEGAPSTLAVRALPVAPLDRQTLDDVVRRQASVLLDRLEPGGQVSGVTTALRELGQRSACLVPLATALGPVGLMVLASTREGAYRGSNLDFLRRVAGQVAVGIDNVRHRQQAVERERQLEGERQHLRTLFDLTNAVVPTRDVGSVLGALAPHLQRVVEHDATSLFLLQPQDPAGVHVIKPALPGWTDELTAQLHPDREPISGWLAGRRPVDLELERADWTGREGIRDVLLGSGLRRGCFVPLATPHGTLGFLVLNRRSSAPFSPAELDRSGQAGAQIAMALENALAFAEIATLKDRLARENVYLEEEIRDVQHFGEIVGESKALKEILRKVATVAETDTTVLLLGETGTGKELIARAIHASSERRERPLVTVNCATSPAGLLESEWFGHEKGAFTGALTQKVGRFELANHGTLFLDEIGELPLELQSKLLRVLQEHEIERLGSTRTLHVDFRLIAATNRDLEAMVQKRELRSDLYYRLNVFPVRIPPLRERVEDIPPLVRYFVQRFAKRLRRPIESVSRESMELLCRWPWPGNVRELQNVIERAVILSQGSVLTVSRSEFETRPEAPGIPVTLEEAERAHILRALEQSNWVVGGEHGAAARLGLKRTSLVSTMRRLGIERPRSPRPPQG